VSRYWSELIWRSYPALVQTSTVNTHPSPSLTLRDARFFLVHSSFWVIASTPVLSIPVTHQTRPSARASERTCSVLTASPFSTNTHPAYTRRHPPLRDDPVLPRSRDTMAHHDLDGVPALFSAYSATEAAHASRSVPIPITAGAGKFSTPAIAPWSRSCLIRPHLPFSVIPGIGATDRVTGGSTAWSSRFVSQQRRTRRMRKWQRRMLWGF
jgi:hypothetical protein